MTLTVADIQFSYNGTSVLSEVGFSLESGQVMCVLGVNGAGKSTLLKCLNRILEPQCGSVHLGADDLYSMSRNEIARRVGYVPQRHPETRLSVFESVLLGRKPHIQWAAGKGDYLVVETVIRQIGLEHLAMRPVDDLSGGEAQKVMIARALAQCPKVLLLDEPTSNLDLRNQMEVMGLIRQLVRTRDLSAVVAIHDLNIAVRFGDKFLFLKDHRIHSVAAREELNAETIEEVYGLEVTLEEVGGRTLVVPM